MQVHLKSLKWEVQIGATSTVERVSPSRPIGKLEKKASTATHSIQLLRGELKNLLFHKAWWSAHLSRSALPTKVSWVHWVAVHHNLSTSDHSLFVGGKMANFGFHCKTNLHICVQICKVQDQLLGQGIAQFCVENLAHEHTVFLTVASLFDSFEFRMGNRYQLYVYHICLNRLNNMRFLHLHWKTFALIIISHG